jgi:hypothetical protein
MPLFKGKSSKAKPKKAIDYITRTDKAVIVSSLFMDDNRNYARQFKETCDLYGKGSKPNERKYYHFKLSIDPDNEPTPEQSHKLAEKLAQELFSAHECIIATHDDTNVIHSHIIVNAVSFETGKKLHLNTTGRGEGSYAHCKDLADELGLKMGFYPLQWREKVAKRKERLENDFVLDDKAMNNAERQLAKRDDSGTLRWKEALHQAIDEAKLNCTDRAGFENYLANNFRVKMPRNTTKTISFVHPAMGENFTVRGAKLGNGYTAYEIDRALENNKYEREENLKNTPSLRTYLVDLHDPEIPDRLEIVKAANDDEAIEQALEFMDEGYGIKIIQIAETDENHNELRCLDFDNSLAYELEESEEFPKIEIPPQKLPMESPLISTLPSPKKKNRGMSR